MKKIEIEKCYVNENGDFFVKVLFQNSNGAYVCNIQSLSSSFPLHHCYVFDDSIPDTWNEIILDCF